MKTRFARCLMAGGIALVSVCHETRGYAQIAPQADANKSITVNGQSAPVIRNYVKNIARPVQGRQISRWNEPICIGFDGIGDKYASFIKGRILNLAQSIKLPVRDPGCQVNLYITLTDHADALAKAMIEARPKMVGNVNHDGLLQPSIVTALEAPRTVRWMTASETVKSEGSPFGTANMTYSDSLIRPGTREDVVSKTIIIDETKLKDVTLLQLADYIAYVAVTTPDLSTNFFRTGQHHDPVRLKWRRLAARQPDGCRSPFSASALQDRCGSNPVYGTERHRRANIEGRAQRSERSQKSPWKRWRHRHDGRDS